MMDDLISRQAAIDTDGLDVEIRCEMCRNPMQTGRGCDGNCKYDEILYEKIIQILNKRITPLPSAQQDCTECEEYDSEKKSCPKYCDVIRKTLEEAQPEHKTGHWIPCSERLPEEYGNYLISIDGGEPDIGTINPNDPRGWSLCDANGFYWASDKALNITAWMPLPEPYRGGGKE